MRFPWQRRADRLQADTARAELGAEQANRRLQEVEAGWPRVRATVDTTRREREKNGFTKAAEVMFSGRGT